LLAGNDVESEGFSQWLASERARLRALAAQVFDACAHRYEREGDGCRAVRAAERLVGVDAANEVGQRRLIELLHRHRGRSIALAQADSLLRLIREEHAAEPEADTLALIAKIRSLPATTGPTRSQAAASEATAQGCDVTPTAAPLPSAPGTPGGDRTLPASALQTRLGALLLLAAAGASALAIVALLAANHGFEDKAKAVASAPNHVPGKSDSWRPPDIFPGAAIDGKALGRYGISAVLVLPFAAPPGDAAAARVAQRISDDLISDLSRFPGLRVISRATSNLFAGRSVDVRAIGAEFGVRYAVDGSVRLEQGHLRINVALVDVATRLNVWSDRIERSEADRTIVQDEIARSLARLLHVNVLSARGRHSLRATANPRIEEQLARAWAIQLSYFSSKGNNEAALLFEQVLQADPENVSALVGLGANSIGAVMTFTAADPAPLLAKAEVLLDKALKLDAQSSLAYYFLGLVEKQSGQGALPPCKDTRVQSEFRPGPRRCRPHPLSHRAAERRPGPRSLCRAPQSEGSEPRVMEPLCRPDLDGKG